jgi:hypothetical protein
MKLGKQILHRIEDLARREGLACWRLETGIHQPEALALYRFRRIRRTRPVRRIRARSAVHLHGEVPTVSKGLESSGPREDICLLDE